MKTTPGAEGRRPGIRAASWLGTALLGLLASHCCPPPPGFVPRIPSECGNWDYETSRHEIRAFANDLADLIPDWEKSYDRSVHLDYGGLKAAALKMARAPRCVQETVIESYRREYCDQLEYDDSKASRMFLLMHVLFVLPTPSMDIGKYRDLPYPVREDPSGRALEIARYRPSLIPGHGRYFNPLLEYREDIEQGYPMRTPAEIQALEFRGRP